MILQDDKIETIFGFSGSNLDLCQSIKIVHSSHTIDRSKCSKNTIVVLWNTPMTSWQVKNGGFTCMSPKINSSRQYGYFKESQIHLRSCTCLNYRTRTTKKSQFWLLHNHLFFSSLQGNHENQSPKKVHFWSLQSELDMSAHTIAFLST